MRSRRTDTISLSKTLRGARLVGGLTLTLAGGALAGVAVLPTSALATPAPIALDAPDNGAPPLVAYSPTDGYTYVAWSAPDSQNGGNGVDLCVLPPHVIGCESGSPVLLTDTNTGALGTNSSNTVGLGGLVVLPGSGEVVVLGTPVETGTVAWASPPGGAAFLTSGGGLQDGGNFISPVSLFYTTNNAVALSSTDVGIFDSYDHFYSYFSDSPFAGPESPSTLPSNTGNANNGGQFDDQGDTQGPVIAAEPAPPPAAAGTYIVVGAGANVSSNETTPTGCINDAATGYGVDVGTTGASGTLNHQGLQPSGFGLLACSAEDPTLASGGTDGIGVLEEEGSAISGAGSDWQMAYRPFNATATGGSFGAPVELSDITGEVLDGVDAVDVSDDSGTGVYAFWEDGNTVLDYSANGGGTWGGPVLTPIPYTAHGVITGIGGGAAEIAYVNNPGTGNQVFLQLVDYQELLIKPTAISTVQRSGTTSGANITIPAGTVGESDTATITGTNAASASGTVDFALYNNSSCSGTPTFAGAAEAANGTATITDDSSTGLPPGSYYWEAAYAGNATNLPSSSPCGSEVLTVTAATTTGSTGKGATIGEGATSTSSTVTVTITCPSACTVTITIEIPTASAARKSKKKPKPLTLATGKFTLPKGGTEKLTLHLTKTGKKVFAAHHGRLKASLLLSEKIDGHTILISKTIKIRPAAKKHKK